MLKRRRGVKIGKSSKCEFPDFLESDGYQSCRKAGKVYRKLGKFYDNRSKISFFFKLACFKMPSTYESSFAYINAFMRDIGDRS